ncbi:PREDICTED: uncharacterized protein LOC109226210 [Nicotiana attenuata]|uniref:uncharacterized protein LOC109226210 n=1 Tax=Nicotiana attenuata TaxID=49451 RepID=UPI000905C5E5|nr:PREDICTED: uncharacterized protein LOC109226210 [Nicotiana attenuata]
MALDMKILQLEIYNDSKLIINQLFGSYEAKKEDLLPYHQYAFASWPFDAWGLEVVGPLPKSSKGQMYILAATDYFSSWVEVIPLKEVKKETVDDFIKSYISFRYCITRYIISDNGNPFDNRLMKSLCEKFGYKQHKSLMYNAPANSLAEAFNKTLGNLLKKVVAKNKRECMRKLGDFARFLLLETSKYPHLVYLLSLTLSPFELLHKSAKEINKEIRFEQIVGDFDAPGSRYGFSYRKYVNLKVPCGQFNFQDFPVSSPKGVP